MDGGSGRGRLIAARALSAMLAPLHSTMLSVVLASVGRELDRPVPELTQLLVTSYLITGVVLQAPAGKIGDRVGHHRTLAIGQAAIVIGSIASL